MSFLHVMRRASRTLAVTLVLLAGCVSAVHAQTPGAATRSKYVILVMTDGFRWQELFTGSDSTLLHLAKGKDVAAVRQAFDRDTPIARREALMPFVWRTIATKGQVLGDASAGSVSQATNGMKFSYPGYSEVITGHADPRIVSNRHGANANRSVFEWLNAQPSLNGHVAAFGGWSAFPRIFNSLHSKVPVYDGAIAVTTPLQAPKQTMTGRFIGLLKRYLPSSTSDSAVHRAAAAFQAAATPRVLFVGFTDTDHWAHASRYDRYLRSAHQVDVFLAELWANAQANPATRDSTTLIVTTDHGRGEGSDWFTHGRSISGAERTWIAAIGPDIPALGVRRDTPTTQSQVAATVAAALGLDWRSAEPRAATALPVFAMTDLTPPAVLSPTPVPDRPAARVRRR